MSKLNVVKVIRVLEDGTREYIDGESLDNFLDYEADALMLAFTHGVKQGKIEWKQEPSLGLTKCRYCGCMLVKEDKRSHERRCKKRSRDEDG